MSFVTGILMEKVAFSTCVPVSDAGLMRPTQARKRIQILAAAAAAYVVCGMDTLIIDLPPTTPPRSYRLINAGQGTLSDSGVGWT